MPRNSNHLAFTLVELLVVLGIIALLMAILLPALARSRQTAQSVVCLSNLRQLAQAAHLYCDAYNGFFPPAYYNPENRPPLVITRNWDFTTIRDTSTGTVIAQPGILWAGQTNPQVQQCPAYDGRSNTPADPYTGYNYNTSYIGHGRHETITAPAKITQVRDPAHCALFGDGQFYGGANKFMRAPLPHAGDTFQHRSAGTQGFRHRGMTNVAFVDGHAEALSQRHVHTTAAEKGLIGAGTGFLSADNSLYDLE